VNVDLCNAVTSLSPLALLVGWREIRYSACREIYGTPGRTWSNLCTGRLNGNRK